MNMRIMIVEDEPILAMSYRMALEKNSHQVTGVFSRGEDAVNGIGKAQPDVVIMDIKLAGNMDGIEAADLIVKNSGIPIIFITGNSDDSTRMRAMDINPLQYIVKPVNIRQLCSMLESGNIIQNVSDEV